MDNDFKPPSRLGKSLRSRLDEQSAATPTPTQEPFRTPDEVAAADALQSNQPDEQPPTVDMNLPASPTKRPKNSGWRQKLALHWPPGKKEYIVIAVLVLLVGGGIAAYALTRPDDKPATIVKNKPKPAAKPTTVASTLTGVPVDPALNAKPVVGVMIENSQAARPQSGLADAGVVFEAVAEGGITRFLALYQNTFPSDVGPVRSARPYYVQWNLGFDASYAHVGGSPDGLAMIRNTGTRDLDQFSNAGAYQRIASRTAPHNVYSNVVGLQDLAVKKGFGTSTYKGFVRKKEAAASQPTARVINLNISGALYNASYEYVPATNSYNRSMAGAPHLDATGARQINPKVVVAMAIPYSLNGKYSVYNVIGSGPVLVFQDGIVTQGTWTKPSDKEQITFADSAGKPLKLNPGQTWLTAITDPTKASYTP